MAARKEVRQPVSPVEFITNVLNLPPELKIIITRTDLTAIEFNVVEKDKEQNTLVKVKIESDYCYLFDLIQSNKASLKEKLKIALEAANNTGEMQSLIYNIPPDYQVN